MTSLKVHLGKQPIGQVAIDGKEENYQFEYIDEWRKEGYAISPHLPLEGNISSGAIKRFLENLLPEGKGLEDLSTFTHISKQNIFGLIQAMGFETSGALRFTRKNEEAAPLFRPISEEELTGRIDEIESRSIIIWDKKQRLSLAGVQEKLPILYKGGEIGLADGTLSSTHILKFQSRRNEHIVVNEYFCMLLAKNSGLTVANVTFRRYGDHPVLMVERFDRTVSDGGIERRHIIDGCQILDLPSSYKYERNFGSGRDVREIREGASFAKLFEAANSCEIPAIAKLRILDWALFNLIISNADAHGKNLSFFIDKEGISVAPYYDLLSILIHEDVDHELAMAYGDEFDADKVLGYPLRLFSEETGLNPKLVSQRLKVLCTKVQNNLENSPIDLTLLSDREKGFIGGLQELISKRAEMLLLSADEMLKVSL